MPNSTEEKNLAALRRHFPSVLDQLEESIQPKNGKEVSAETILIRDVPRLRFTTPSGAFFAEPPYQTQEKARQILTESLAESNPQADTLICLGSSFVTLIQVLLESPTEKIKSVIVIEPEPFVLRAAIKYLDFTGVLSDTRLKFLVNHDAAVCADSLASEIHPMQSLGWSIALNPDSYQFYKSFLYDFRARLESVSNNVRLNLLTSIRHADRFLINSFRNYSSHGHCPDVRIFRDLARGLPAVLVAAGPSLEKQIPKLKRLRDRLLMVCVGPAWKTLRMHGIVPHFVVSIDPFDPNYTHFEGLEARGEWLISDLANSCEVVNTFQGPIAFCVSNEQQKTIFEALRDRELTILETGGSVAHTAMWFCRLLGADPIVLIGQDLAYTGGISHAHGHTGRSSLETEKALNPEAFRTVEAFGGDGLVTTNKQMDVYRLYYERLPTKADLINATEGGAKIAGVREGCFDEAIASHLDSDSYSDLYSHFLSSMDRLDQSSRLTSSENERDYRARRELWEALKRTRNQAKKCVALMEMILDAADKGRPSERLKERYNLAIRKMTEMPPSADFLLSALLTNEVFVSQRNFNLFSGNERKHLETNYSLQSRIVSASNRALELILWFEAKEIEPCRARSPSADAL